MALGIADIVSLIMGLSGFGLQPNPKAPTVDAALQYAMPDADVVVHVDAVSFVPHNFKALTQLPELPAIKASPELSRMVTEAITQVDQGRKLATAMSGIDVVDDIADATAFFQIVPNHDPMFVIAVHGRFSTETIDKLATLTGAPPTKVGSGEMTTKGEQAIGVTKDKVLLVGSTQLVKDRLADSWRAPAHRSGALAGAAEVIAGKPVFAIMVAMTPSARSYLTPLIANGSAAAADLFTRCKAASFALYHDGVGWSWTDSSKDGFDAMVMLSDGVIDLMRASQIAPRGIAKIALGALESFKSDPRIAAVLRHRDDLLKVVTGFTGDGTFRVKADKDAKGFKLTIRATGKSLSEVLPVGLVVPVALAGAVFALSERQQRPLPPAMIATPPTRSLPPPRPAPAPRH